MKPSDLLRGEFVGVKDLRQNIGAFLKSKKPKIVTDRGQPRQVLVAFEDFVELIEILEELRNRTLMRRLEEARRHYRQGRQVPLAKLAKDFDLAA